MDIRGDYFMVYAVIMSGGLGSRFWPKSRKNLPKQFLKTVGDKTMIECTVDRILNVVPKDNVCVVTNKSYVKIIKDLLSIKEENIFKEPANKETALFIIQVICKNKVIGSFYILNFMILILLIIIMK